MGEKKVENKQEFVVDKNKIRIDKYLAKKTSQSRSYLQSLVDQGNVLVNGETVKKSHKLNTGDKVNLSIPVPKKLDLKAVPMELDILFEDDHIIVINKPAGLIVHPVPGNREKTLVNGLLHHVEGLSGIGGVKRPGIVHRLDKDTSGTMVVAKDDVSHRNLVKQFKHRDTEKIYHTIVEGKLSYEKGKIKAPIGRNTDNRTKMAVTRENSKKALTLFKVIKNYENYSYVEVTLKTGRTHQIRVHFSYMGHPVLGDQKYGTRKNKFGVKRQLLHAYKLGFTHPVNGGWMDFVAPIPDDFKRVLNKLK